MKLKRREFLKLSAATVGALALGTDALAQGLGERIPNPFRAMPGKWFDETVTTTYSYCENCFWKCGIKAYGLRRQGAQGRRLHREPQVARHALPARPGRRRPDLRPRSPEGAAHPRRRLGARRRSLPRGELGRSARLHRRQDAGHQDRVRHRVGRLLRPRLGRQLVRQLPPRRLGEPQRRQALGQPLHRAARDRQPVHLRPRHLGARADRLVRDRLHRPDRAPHRRGHPQHPVAGLLDGAQARRRARRRRPALLGRGRQGEGLAARSSPAPTPPCCSRG